MTDITSINSSGFLLHLFDFFHKLEDEGINVTLHQEIDACRSFQYVDVFNFEEFYHSLKTILISQQKDIRIFDTVFFLHWDFSEKSGEPEKKRSEKRNSGETAEDDTALPSPGGEEVETIADGQETLEIIYSEPRIDRLAEEDSGPDEEVAYSPNGS